MKRKTEHDYYLIQCAAGHACRHMENARDSLRRAGADKAADAVARALKSVRGAERNAAAQLSRSRYE